MNELIRYGIAGVINTATGYGVFWVLLRQAAFSPELANAVSYAIALGVAFLLNRFFVFSGAKASAGAVLRFIAAFAASFSLNQAVLFVLFRIFSIPAEIAQVFAMIVYTVVFYLMNKHFIFKDSRQPVIAAETAYSDRSGASSASGKGPLIDITATAKFKRRKIQPQRLGFAVIATLAGLGLGLTPGLPKIYLPFHSEQNATWHTLGEGDPDWQALFNIANLAPYLLENMLGLLLILSFLLIVTKYRRLRELLIFLLPYAITIILCLSFALVRIRLE